MVLALQPPDFWLYGYLGALFAGTPWFAVAVPLLIWLLAVFAVHRADEFDGQAGLEALLADLILFIPANAVLGALAGLVVQYAAALPPLVRFFARPWHFGVEARDDGSGRDIDGTRRVDADARPTLFAAGGLLGALAGYFLRDGFAFGTGVSLVVGLALLALALVLGIGALWSQFASSERAARADARYQLYLATGVLAAFFYDSLEPYRPAHGIAALVYIVLWAGVVLWIEVSVLGVDGKPAQHEGDARYLRIERYPGRIALRWLVFTALPLLGAYALGWALDVASGGLVVNITAAMGGYTLGIVVLALVLGGVRSRALGTSAFRSTVVTGGDARTQAAASPAPAAWARRPSTAHLSHRGSGGSFAVPLD